MEQLTFFETKTCKKYKDAKEKHLSVRTTFMDTIKKFSEYAKTQESSNYQMYYVHLSKLVNKKAGVNPDEFKDSNDLKRMMSIENSIIDILNKSMKKKEDYHEIYRKCKELSGI